MTAKYYAAASILLPCSGALIWPGKVWFIAICLMWIVAAAAYWIYTERKEHRNRLTNTIKAMQSSSIRMLNHHRHDWMNELQVLFGYARLGKLDKIIGYVDKIRDRMAVESAVSKLGAPSLISFIQSFRELTNVMSLEVAIKGELNLNQLDLDGDAVAEAIIHTINVYRFAGKPGSTGMSVLRLELSADDEALYAGFYYEGEWINEKQGVHKIIQQLKGTPFKPIGSELSCLRLMLRAEMRV